MKDKTNVEDVLSILPSDVRESLYVLSIPNVLSDSLAKELLIKTGKANGNALQIVEELRYFPIWHDRTINSWIFDEDVRKYSFEKL